MCYSGAICLGITHLGDWRRLRRPLLAVFRRDVGGQRGWAATCGGGGGQWGGGGRSGVGSGAIGGVGHGCGPIGAVGHTASESWRRGGGVGGAGVGVRSGWLGDYGFD